jgi:hypothetical protein
MNTRLAVPSSTFSLRNPRSRGPLWHGALALWLGGVACAASGAEPTLTAPGVVAPADQSEPGQRAVGDATAQLLALQRSGAAASPVERPIPGDVAARSYQRYLKSFEHPIPERFDTTVGGGAAAGSGTR